MPKAPELVHGQVRFRAQTRNTGMKKHTGSCPGPMSRSILTPSSSTWTRPPPCPQHLPKAEPSHPAKISCPCGQVRRGGRSGRAGEGPVTPNHPAGCPEKTKPSLLPPPVCPVSHMFPVSQSQYLTERRDVGSCELEGPSSPETTPPRLHLPRRKGRETPIGKRERLRPQILLPTSPPHPCAKGGRPWKCGFLPPSGGGCGAPGCRPGSASAHDTCLSLSCSDYPLQELCLFFPCTSNAQFRTHHPSSLSHQHPSSSSVIPNP